MSEAIHTKLHQLELYKYEMNKDNNRYAKMDK